MGATSRLATAVALACICSTPALAGPATATLAVTSTSNQTISLSLDLASTSVAGEYVVDGISGTFSGTNQNGLDPYTASITGLFTGTKQNITPDNLLYDPAIFGLPVDARGIGFTDATGQSNILLATVYSSSARAILSITQSNGFSSASSLAVTIYPNGVPVPEPGGLAVLAGAVAMLVGVRGWRRAHR